MRAHEDEFRAAGAQLAAVGLGDARYAKMFREETGISFPLLVDEARTAYRKAGLRSASLLHLFYKANGVARARAKSGGHRQHKLGKNPMQLGGSLVAGPGNVDRYVHVSETFGDNATPETLLAAVRG